jgi:hypothetical protein
VRNFGAAEPQNCTSESRRPAQSQIVAKLRSQADVVHLLPLDRRRAHSAYADAVVKSTSGLWFEFGLRVPSGALTAQTFRAVSCSPRQRFVTGVGLTLAH